MYISCILNLTLVFNNTIYTGAQNSTLGNLVVLLWLLISYERKYNILLPNSLIRVQIKFDTFFQCYTVPNKLFCKHLYQIDMHTGVCVCVLKVQILTSKVEDESIFRSKYLMNDYISIMIDDKVTVLLASFLFFSLRQGASLHM